MRQVLLPPLLLFSIFSCSTVYSMENIIIRLNEFLQDQCQHEMNLNVTKKVIVHFMENERNGGQESCSGPVVVMLSENCRRPTLTCANVLEYYRKLDAQSRGNIIGH